MRLPRAIALALLAATLSLAQTKQAMDEEYARLVKEWTTAPEFMSPLVDHLPKAPGVPTTKDVLGYYAGAPKKLTRVADLGKYYRALAGASKRVKLLPIGTTDEGRECLVVEWTTAPEFMSPLVDHLPKAPGVPTTKDVLGYYAGAPKKLTRVADLGKYYRALAAASKRVKLLPIGTTDEGREC